MTDRTPPQEREREARERLDHFVNGALLGQPVGVYRLDAYAAAVAARVRAELRERVEGMIDAKREAGMRGAWGENSAAHVSGLRAVLAALSEETTG